MNYLLESKDQHRYDSIESERIIGEHPEKPEFTIMIPTYKRPELLKESLESALNQKRFHNYEIIVVDNNGEESVKDSPTLKVIKEFNSSKVIYYKNRENIGIYGNTLRGAQLAKGDYVVLLNDDDLLHPYYLYVMKEFIKKHNYHGVMGSRPCEFYKSGYKFPDLPDKVPAFKVSEFEFFFGCAVTSPGLMYPRKILYDIYNSYEELLMGDQIIQYKGLKKYSLVFVSFPLAAYRVQENETQKDEVLCDMIYHMCLFRKQTSRDNIFLKYFMKFFQKEYYNWYINSSLYFWKKRGLRKRIAKRLKIDLISKWNLKQILVNNLIEQIHNWYSKKRGLTSDYVDISNEED